MPQAVDVCVLLVDEAAPAWCVMSMVLSIVRTGMIAFRISLACFCGISCVVHFGILAAT